MSTDPGATTLLDLSGESRLETVTADDAYLHQVRSVVQMHLDIAARLTREGSALMGFQELVRASRAVPMNARLAAALVSTGLRAGTHAVALVLITEGLEDAEGEERVDLERQLARLARRSGDLEKAQEVITAILAGRSGDRRARAVLNAILARRQRWDELDASLDKDTRELLRLGKLKAASRSALRRARLWAETLDDPARAALRAMQAAQYAEQGRDLQSAFVLRLLWLRNLHRARAPGRALEEAARVVLSLGDRVGQRESAQSLVDELGLAQDTDSGDRTVNSVDTTPVVSTVNSTSGEVTPSGPPSPAAPRRHSTQLELMAVAQAAEAVGRKPEAAAILAAAVREGPDPRAAQKLEAHFVQRGAWRELAGFYRDTLARTTVKTERAQWAEKLAEVLESELKDVEGAARAWAEVAAATGDTRAVSEQVRLLAQQKDNTGVREALDAGVKQAQAPAERSRALVLRAEEALTRREVAAARADFEAALKVSAWQPEAAAGLAELAAIQGNLAAPLKFLEQTLARIQKRTPGRGDLFRRLARLADSPARDARLSRLSWAEVLAELPGDEEASARLLALTRAAGDDVALERLLLEALARDPRGARPRQLRMELVTLLERAGRNGDALEALKQAVRAEPGHREAWLAYAERLIGLGQRDAEAAWALEHAATATDDPQQRFRLWQRLGAFVREQLGDEARAITYETRAEKLQRELHPDVPPPLVPRPSPAKPPPIRAQVLPAAPPPLPSHLPGGPLVIPPRRGLKPKSAPVLLSQAQEVAFEKLAVKLGARVEPQQKSREHVRIAPRVARQLASFGGEPLLVPRPGPPIFDAGGERADEEDLEDPGGPTRELAMEDDVTPTPASPAEPDPEEIASSEVELPDEDDRRRGPVPQPEPDEIVEERRTAELRVELGDPSVSVPPSFGPSPARALTAEREALFERVRHNPIEADGYRLLAEHFDTANDAARSSLMLEIARALEGDPHAAPRAPRLILNATDRAGLKHPALRGEGGELLSLVGTALCRLNPARGKDAGTDDEFHLDAGKGARAVADALLSAVRILGVRSPDVYLSDEPGPPLSLVFTTEPRILVGKLAVKKEVTDAELRFFAGRTLFTQQPELMALRSLRREQVLRGLVLVSQVGEGRASPAETRLFREAVPARAWDRLKQLVKAVGTRLDLAGLTDGARHSANRAGLVVCGGIAPAIASLRAKKALPSEMMELVRFAASERYLQLRNRNVPRK
ncbi:MAG: tetratricopeptide repeat protein [Archangium sp.]|nr:tetratricopeptide repeat protein [Archangium sp.]